MSGDHEYILVVSTPYSAQQLITDIFLIGQKRSRMELNGTSINVFVLIYRLRSTVEAAATTTAGADSV